MTNTFDFARVTRTLLTPVIEPVIRWRRRASMARQLRALDDRTLDDIGISRYRIPAVVAQAYAARLVEEPAQAGARVHALPMDVNDRRTARIDILRSKAA
jgi:uncharacterized protein YjiS (DUF1127 family)